MNKKNDRLERQKEFDLLIPILKDSFKCFANCYMNCNNNEIFQNYHIDKYIDDNGRKIVMMNWGYRAIGKKKQDNDDISIKPETSTHLQFQQLENGYVIIQLFPAYTENIHQIEDYILLGLRVNPAKFRKCYFKKWLWYVFISYSEVTSIDGSPSFWQRLCIWYLRNFKRLVVNGAMIPVKFYSFLRKFGIWFLTVAFSGLAIFLLQMWLQPNPAEHTNVETIKETSVETYHLFEDMQKEIIKIENNQDSMMDLLGDIKL